MGRPNRPQPEALRAHAASRLAHFEVRGVAERDHRQARRLHLEESEVRLGIAADHVPLLFKRFSRLPTAENKSISGTGLALYLCQEIARRHGGEIDVSSKVREGTRFTLRLPADGASD